LAIAKFRAQGESHKKVKDPGAVIHLKVYDLEIVSNAYLEFMKYLTEVHDKKGFEMWAKSVNIRAKEEDFARKIAKMYEDMNRHTATNERQDKPSKHGLFQTPGQGASGLITQPSAHGAAYVGSGLTKNGAVHTNNQSLPQPLVSLHQAPGHPILRHLLNSHIRSSSHNPRDLAPHKVIPLQAHGLDIIIIRAVMRSHRQAILPALRRWHHNHTSHGSLTRGTRIILCSRPSRRRSSRVTYRRHPTTTRRVVMVAPLDLWKFVYQ
jgi:hypothetical protein